jgi:beta-galactosidase
LKMGTPTNTAGDPITVNNFYVSRNDVPWLPVMGEIHFSCYPRHMWEDAIRRPFLLNQNTTIGYTSLRSSRC